VRNDQHCLLICVLITAASRTDLSDREMPPSM